MMKQILSLVVLIVLAALLPAAAAADTGTGGASPDSLEIDDGANNRLLSLGFIPNVGQYDPVVDYVLHCQGTTVFFMRDGLVLAHTAGSAENVSRDVIRQSFAGASPETHLAARDQRAGVVNYYVGNDSSKWLSGIPVCSEVVYEDLYPGIDLVYAEKNGRLKREFRISPGADPSRIELIYEGESEPYVDGDGVLRFASPAGEMLESPLVCWQVIGGKRVDRVAEYVVDDGSVRIGVAEYDAGYELIIDPELVYSSYLGGGEGDYGYALAGDGDGGVWVTGYTASPDFPVLDDSDGKSGHIAFVSHFASNGTLLSSTCLGGARSLGGTRSDYGHVLAGDDEGGVWVIGTTGSDFPVLNASQSAYGGEGDVFVSHFSSSGTLLSSTYLGGGGRELDNALVGDGDGGVWVAGLTTSTNLPVTEDAYQSTYGGGSGDAFVSHFSSTGALLSSTYLGGENYDYGSALAGDGAGGVWVMGGNQYGGFPVLNAYQRTNGGGWDVFVSHFSSSGTLLSSTYLGGSNHDDGSALAGDGNGGVWVTGETRSVHVPDFDTGFPVRNAYQSNNRGYYDAFVSHLSSEGALLASTYLGGDEYDSGYALAGDGDGGVWVTGRTRSADFPVRNAYQSTYGGVSTYGDRFVSHFSSAGTLLSSTYLGGEADDCDGGRGREDDHRYTLVGDDAGGVWVTGCTASTAFPVLDEYQSTNGGGWDAFVSHFASDGALLLSTYLGGDGDDHGRALADDGHGGVWVTGYTGSPGFPVLNAYQSSYGGNGDVFVARFGIDDPVPVHPPTANFTANATSGTAPLAVQFTDLSTGDPTAWLWGFGDGATSTDQHPIHTYTAPGTYTVTLTVSNAVGSGSAVKTDYITVTKAGTGGLADSAWPKFHMDPSNSGQSPYNGPQTNNILWTYPVEGEIRGSPAIGVDGTIYFGSYGSIVDGIFKGKVYALNPDGTLKWNYTTGGIVPSSPAIGADGTIYIGSFIEGGKTTLLALNPNGTLKWNQTGGGWSSPAIDTDGTIYIGGTERLYALSPDGTQKWATKALGHLDGAPAIGADGTIYIGNPSPTADKFYALNPNGTVKWDYTPKDVTEDPTKSTHVYFGSPAIGADGTIYVGTDGNNPSKPPKLYALNPDGTLKWNYTSGASTFWSSPTIDTDGTIYIGGFEKLYALNPDGTLKWNYTTGDKVGGSPAIGADGTIYIGSYDGNVYALNPEGSLKWTQTTGERTIYSSPAIGSDGTLYIGSSGGMGPYQGILYAFKDSGLVANFTANVTSGTEPLAVRFTDLSTGSPTTWLWDFGDKETSTEQHPVHTYTAPGTYTVTLTVSNGYVEDTMRKELYIWVQPAPPDAEFIFNVNYNRGTSNDSIASGTSPCSLAYHMGVYNLPDSQESIHGNITFVLDAPGIIDAEPDKHAEIDGTRVTWTFPPQTAIRPGTALSTSAATSATANRSSGVTLERSCNRTVFTEAGVQQVTLNITFDTIDLDDLWGRIMCTNTADVRSAFVPGTISTDLPLLPPSEESTKIQFTIDPSAVEAGRQYTLSCAVAVEPLRPVAYAPACAVWEVWNATSAVAPAGTAVTLPAELLPQSVNSVEFSSNTSCEWTCALNDHVITSLHQRAVPVSAPVANFSANVTAGPAPLAVRFTDASTGEITAWFWSFGDGNASAEQNPVHTYGAPGNYTVNLTVSTEDGSDTLSRPGYITVTVKGDFGGDGEVDIGDVSRVAYMVVGKTAVDPAADFNGNGAVDIGDAAKIAYYFVGKIEAL